MGIGELVPILSGAGVAGALVFVIGYLITGNRNDRKDYRLALDERDVDLAESKQRERDAQKVIDELRKEKRTIEDENDRLKRRVITLENQAGGGPSGSVP